MCSQISTVSHHETSIITHRCRVHGRFLFFFFTLPLKTCPACLHISCLRMVLVNALRTCCCFHFLWPFVSVCLLQRMYIGAIQFGNKRLINGAYRYVPYTHRAIDRVCLCSLLSIRSPPFHSPIIFSHDLTSQAVSDLFMRAPSEGTLNHPTAGAREAADDLWLLNTDGGTFEHLSTSAGNQ